MQSAQSPARRVVERSLDSSDVNSFSLPAATSPCPTDDAEVLSQKVPSQEEVVLEAPQGDLPDSRRKGEKTQGLQVRPWAEHRTGTFNGYGVRQEAP